MGRTTKFWKVFIFLAGGFLLMWNKYQLETPTIHLDIRNSTIHAFCADATCTRHCQLELKGYSTIDDGFYIKVNGQTYASPEKRGLLIISMIPGAVCKVKDKRLITSENSMTFAKYLGSLQIGDVVFGVTGGGVPDFMNEASGYMKTSGIISIPSNLTGTDTLLFRAMKRHDSYADFVVRKQADARAWNTQLLMTSPMHITLKDVPLEEVERSHPDVMPGQGWSPVACRPRWRLAVIIPFRDRHEHLTIFLNNFLKLLKKQHIAFHVFVLEQSKPELFNRAALMNAGYLEAQRVGRFDCFAFHDVDHIPEDVCNVYSCSEQPRHLSVAKDSNNYQILYRTMFGGASLLSHTHIQKINGFPNTFFGWGGEDDNIFSRLHNAGYVIARYPTYVARYTIIPHKREHKSNPNARRGFTQSLESATLYWEYDGLNSVDYSVQRVVKEKLFTRITVKLPGPVNAEQQEEYFQQKTKQFIMQKRNQQRESRSNT